MKFFKLFIVLMSIFLIASCGARGALKYPDTPTGQGALFIGAYHDQVDIYVADVKWAENPQHIEILKSRLEAMQYADETINQIGKVVAAGGTIPEGLLMSYKTSLNEIKKYLYTKQAFPRSKAEIEVALVRAGIIPELRSEGWETIILLLIELVQSFQPMWDRLDNMAGMTPEQVQAEFDYQWSWKQSFNPYTLPEPMEKP